MWHEDADVTYQGSCKSSLRLLGENFEGKVRVREWGIFNSNQASLLLEH